MKWHLNNFKIAMPSCTVGHIILNKPICILTESSWKKNSINTFKVYSSKKNTAFLLSLSSNLFVFKITSGKEVKYRKQITSAHPCHCKAVPGHSVFIFYILVQIGHMIDHRKLHGVMPEFSNVAIGPRLMRQFVRIQM